MIDTRWEHCNETVIHRRMTMIRDRLGDLAAAGLYLNQLSREEQHTLGTLFRGDMTLFAFMDEKPGDMLLNGRPPQGDRHGGPGFYYDGQGRQGWHTLLRQLRNSSDPFWEGFHGNQPAAA